MLHKNLIDCQFFVKVGSFVSFIHLLPLQAKVLQTISGISYGAASSKRLYTYPKLPALRTPTPRTVESIDYSVKPQSVVGLDTTESESDSTMFDPRLVPKLNQTT